MDGPCVNLFLKRKLSLPRKVIIDAKMFRLLSSVGNLFITSSSHNFQKRSTGNGFSV